MEFLDGPTGTLTLFPQMIWLVVWNKTIGKPSENGDLTKKNGDLIWLVVWNMNFMTWECHHPN